MDQTSETSVLGYSPNLDEGLDFHQALSRLHTSNQAAFRKMTDQILRQTGHKDFQTHDAIGDWSDGAENSVLQIIHGHYDPDSLKYAAAWYGLLGNQKSVLAFMSDPEGPDSVYQIPVPDTDTERVRTNLDKLGIKFRTLIPTSKGHLVVVVDQGRLNRQAIAKFAEGYSAPVREAAGHTEYMGGDGTRASARQAFRSRIREYEGTGQSETPAQVHQSGQTLRHGTPRASGAPQKPQVAKMGAVKAPPRGAIVRGLYYPGGKFLPKEAEQAPQAYSNRTPPCGMDQGMEPEYPRGHPKHPRTKSIQNPRL